MKYHAQTLNILLALALVLLCLQTFFIKTSEPKIPPTTQQQQNIMTYEHYTQSVLGVIHARKSVRHFTKQEVSAEQLETLVRAGMAAPTAINKQPWSFFILQDRKVLDLLADTLPYAKMLYQAPAAIVVCGDMNKTIMGKDDLYWIMDCSAATQNILLAAEAMGLGAVWTAAFPDPKRVKPVKEYLNMPEHMIPLCVIPVGYPTGEDKPKNKWKPENLFWETYSR